MTSSMLKISKPKTMSLYSDINFDFGSGTQMNADPPSTVAPASPLENYDAMQYSLDVDLETDDTSYDPRFDQVSSSNGQWEEPPDSVTSSQDLTFRPDLELASRSLWLPDETLEENRARLPAIDPYEEPGYVNFDFVFYNHFADGHSFELRSTKPLATFLKKVKAGLRYDGCRDCFLFGHWPKDEEPMNIVMNATGPSVKFELQGSDIHVTVYTRYGNCDCVTFWVGGDSSADDFAKLLWSHYTRLSSEENDRSSE
jgi:hypothetical protein